ncbi:MAG: hypothetical protein DME37_13540 [Verrucomicrobia bacterium]|nr:MAG: hypothetical protein DME37_13540 [Verrucomicrobiota bacterium]
MRNKIKNRVARRRRGRALLAGTACALSNLAKEFSNASRDFNFNLSHRYLRNHARRSHIADAHCLQRTGPLPTTRRTGESRELEGVAHWTTDCSGGPGDGRNALPLFHARNRQLLRYIEIDRYRHAECTGDYLSRLHYLEDWLYDNDRRGLVSDLTRSLGGVSVPHSAREMTNGWRHYRYLVHNRGLLRPLAEMEAEVSSRSLYEIPKGRVAAIESRLRSGDIIGIVSRDGRHTSVRATSHVGLALRTADGTIHFMHASAPHNYGRVVIDTRLSNYLYRYSSDTGILVARPLR